MGEIYRFTNSRVVNSNSGIVNSNNVNTVITGDTVIYRNFPSSAVHSNSPFQQNSGTRIVDMRNSGGSNMNYRNIDCASSLINLLSQNTATHAHNPSSNNINSNNINSTITGNTITYVRRGEGGPSTTVFGSGNVNAYVGGAQPIGEFSIIDTTASYHAASGMPSSSASGNARSLPSKESKKRPRCRLRKMAENAFKAFTIAIRSICSPTRLCKTQTKEDCDDISTPPSYEEITGIQKVNAQPSSRTTFPNSGVDAKPKTRGRFSS